MRMWLVPLSHRMFCTKQPNKKMKRVGGCAGKVCAGMVWGVHAVVSQALEGGQQPLLPVVTLHLLHREQRHDMHREQQQQQQQHHHHHHHHHHTPPPPPRTCSATMSHLASVTSLNILRGPHHARIQHKKAFVLSPAPAAAPRQRPIGTVRECLCHLKGITVMLLGVKSSSTRASPPAVWRRFGRGC